MLLKINRPTWGNDNRTIASKSQVRQRRKQEQDTGGLVATRATGPPAPNPFYVPVHNRRIPLDEIEVSGYNNWCSPSWME
jgi:hypothetical protein